MSGYMVTTDNGDGHRNLYMVNLDDPERARLAVNQAIGLSNAEALSPIPAATIDHYKLEPGQVWLCTTINSACEVTSSALADRS